MIRSRRPRLPGLPRAVVALAALALVASGCDGLQGTGDGQYIDQGSSITLIKPADRSGPLDVTGTSLEGTPLDLATYRGAGKEPVVLNVWGTWCGGCQEESATLAAASRSVKAQFVGIDIRDSDPQSALAYDKSVGITYPSFYDPSSETFLKFGRHVPVAPPETYVLDDQGRIAAIITAPLTSTTTLDDIVKQTAAGK